MISTERNERFWTKGCDWTVPNSDPTVDPTGKVDNLPSPSDPVSFTGHLIRDAVQKILKPGEVMLVAMHDENDFEVMLGQSGTIDPAFTGSADTIWEAMFNAFEKALGLDKEEK